MPNPEDNKTATLEDVLPTLKSPEAYIRGKLGDFRRRSKPSPENPRLEGQVSLNVALPRPPSIHTDFDCDHFTGPRSGLVSLEDEGSSFSIDSKSIH